MIPLVWQRYIQDNLQRFNSLSLLHLLKHMSWVYTTETVPHLHFSGHSIADVGFKNQVIAVKHYDLSATGFNSILPLHFAIQYWKEEREGKIGIYALLLKALEKQFYNNFLKAQVMHRICLNPYAFNKTTEALVGAMRESHAIKNLMVRYSAYTVKKSISRADLSLVLQSYLEAEVTIEPLHFDYAALDQTQCSRVAKQHNQVGRDFLLGRGMYEVSQRLIVKIRLNISQYRELVCNPYNLKILLGFIKKLLRKVVPIELQFFLNLPERRRFMMSKSQLGMFSWFSGTPVIDLPMCIKEK